VVIGKMIMGDSAKLYIARSIREHIHRQQAHGVLLFWVAQGNHQRDSGKMESQYMTRHSSWMREGMLTV
jgi:hypothetical protein